MGKLTDKSINGKIRAGERFELSDGGGLTLAFRESYQKPVWRLRYRIAGKARVAVIGKYGDLPLADARATAKELRARVTLGHDVAAEIQERKREAGAKIEAARAGAYTVSALLDDFIKQYAMKVKKVRGADGKLLVVKVPRWKHPEIVNARFERDIRPELGELPVDEVRAHHVQTMLNKIVERGAPTTANDVLRWTRKVFDFAINQERTALVRNPAARLSDEDAGGAEFARERALSRDELVKFFAAMRKTPGFSIQNYHTFKLLLLLAVRKSELVMARVDEFNLKAGEWKLPGGRTKTEAAIDIPLSAPAVKALRELVRLGEGSDYLLPARKAQDRMLPHIHENTLNVALSKVRKLMPGVPHFHVHDLRRTARTTLAALKVDRFVAERCLNHKIKGVEGIYDAHEYFDERREALNKLAAFIEECEAGKPTKRGARS
jgi:integrase